MNKTFTLNLDVTKGTANAVPTYKQGDTNKLRLKLYNGGNLIDLTTYVSSTFTFELKNGEVLTGTGKYVDGFVEYDFIGLELKLVGTIRVIVTVSTSNGTVSTQPFKIFSYDVMDKDSVTYLDILNELIEEVKELGLEMEELIANTEGELQQIFKDAQDRLNELQNQIDEFVETADTELQEAIDNIADFDFKGTYDPNVQYEKHNVVYYNKNSYVALKDNISITPSDDGVNWRLIALGGVDGTGSVSSINGIFPDENGNVVIATGGEVIDNLNTQSTVDSLSANQGYVLNNKVVNHADNTTEQKHVTFGTTIPENTVKMGLLVRQTGDGVDIP